MPTIQESPRLASFPLPVRQFIDDIEGSGPLGTSTVIGLYGRALDLLATESTAKTASELAEQAEEMIDYFLNTRGRFTVAVANSFASLLPQLGELRRSEHSAKRVIQALQDYNRHLEAVRQDRLNAIATVGADLLAGAESLLLYDYSSTVMKVVAGLAANNVKLKLVVPESRTCNGGLPILRQGKELGCELWMIPDVTLAFAMPECDAVLVGVETFFRDGSFTNTVGSLTTAIVAKHFAVPFYAVTDLTKADLAGSRDVQPQRAFTAPLEGRHDLSEEDLIETSYSPLEGVPARLVTAYITEKGVVEPAKIWTAAPSEYGGESK